MFYHRASDWSHLKLQAEVAVGTLQTTASAALASATAGIQHSKAAKYGVGKTGVALAEQRNGCPVLIWEKDIAL
jgi:hypothetical protein